MTARLFRYAAILFGVGAIITLALPLGHPITKGSAYATAMKSDLSALVAVEDALRARTGRYSSDLAELELRPSVRVKPPNIVLTDDGWYAANAHTQTDIWCSVWVGSTGYDPADEERVPACTESRDWSFLWYAAVLLSLSAIFALIDRLHASKTSLTQAER